jgi:hypothetical protein
MAANGFLRPLIAHTVFFSFILSTTRGGIRAPLIRYSSLELADNLGVLPRRGNARRRVAPGAPAGPPADAAHDAPHASGRRLAEGCPEAPDYSHISIYSLGFSYVLLFAEWKAAGEMVLIYLV